MPNWSRNHTVFIGKKTTLDTIYASISNGEFDFDQLRPRPEVYDLYPSPVHVIADAEFAEKYSIDDAPTTIAEFIDAYKQYNSNNTPDKQFRDVPETVHALIRETYGHDDWYNWCTHKWGTKWTGSNADPTRYLPNLLIVDYDTAWCAPDDLFRYLEEEHPDLDIINASEIEGFSDDITANWGSDLAFGAYYTVTKSTKIESYSFVWSHNTEDGIEIFTDNECYINDENIRTMVKKKCLINAAGEVIAISEIE